MKIVVLDGYTLSGAGNSWDELAKHGELLVFERSTPDEIRERARDADILITNKARISAEVISEAKQLKFIAVSATGFDCVDVAAAKQRGIPVANVPVYGSDSVAQFAFALLLHLCQPVALHAEAVRAGEWSRAPDFCFWKAPLLELAGKKMGIVGMGRIGRRVGELAHAFGMEVLACSPSRRAPPAYQPIRWVELDELAQAADVISLHCPLTPRTAGLVNRDFLGKIKPGAYLINTARGGLIVERDLADALNEGRLAGAAIDVVTTEPIQADNPLLHAKNCVITPHIAWATREARRRLLEATMANVVAFLMGKVTNVVNGVSLAT